jgi:hypothetical protein
VTIETSVQGEHARSERQLGFTPGSTVDVRQIDDQDWKVLRALTYYASTEVFEVPVGEHTDFASVPREFVWFIPRYGRYTKAAILHDYLCSKVVPAHTISRIGADGIFRQAMRELGVPFLRRWIMWAAVRLGALTNSAGREVVDRCLACRLDSSLGPAGHHARRCRDRDLVPGFLPH